VPARDKTIAPRYPEIGGSRIPRAEGADGRVTVRVIAGEPIARYGPFVMGAPSLHDGSRRIVDVDVDVDVDGSVRDEHRGGDPSGVRGLPDGADGTHRLLTPVIP
jgi:hypothetical protein